MVVTKEINLESFEAWGGAARTLERLCSRGVVRTLEQILEEEYPAGIDETTLNDILWFDDDWCYEVCSIETEQMVLDEIEEIEYQIDILKDDYESKDITVEEYTKESAYLCNRLTELNELLDEF